MRESPRARRLRSDLKAMEQLRDQSTILEFKTPGPMFGGPPEAYRVRFYGKGVWRPERSQETLIRERHEVTISLTASYPRTIPELSWKSPIFHPNISAGGVVCLGGYGTHWVPSLSLDELCGMLWDMIRYENYDVESPYNRDAALWARTQQQYRLPLDKRPIRDKVALDNQPAQRPPITTAPLIVFENEVVEAEVVLPDAVQPGVVRVDPAELEDSDIMFLD